MKCRNSAYALADRRPAVIGYNYGSPHDDGARLRRSCWLSAPCWAWTEATTCPMSSSKAKGKRRAEEQKPPLTADPDDDEEGMGEFEDEYGDEFEQEEIYARGGHGRR